MAAVQQVLIKKQTNAETKAYQGRDTVGVGVMERVEA
jgi:hypothetical protein